LCSALIELLVGQVLLREVLPDALQPLDEVRAPARC
jgi:hypothetical protein